MSAGGQAENTASGAGAGVAADAFLPLGGHRILLTRRRPQALPLRARLRAAGARVNILPLIELAPPADTGPLDAQLQHIETFAWIFFTSPNAVRFFHARLQAAGRDSSALAGMRLAVVGAATAAALRNHGLRARLVPQVQTTEGLIAACRGQNLSGARILLPTSALAPDRLAHALTTMGARVTRVTAYVNRAPRPAPRRVHALMAAHPRVDTVVFASPSAVRHLPLYLGTRNAATLLADAVIVAMGPTTAAALRHHGWGPHVQPTHSSVPALAAALCAYYQARPCVPTPPPPPG